MTACALLSFIALLIRGILDDGSVEYFVNALGFVLALVWTSQTPADGEPLSYTFQKIKIFKGLTEAAGIKIKSISSID